MTNTDLSKNPFEYDAAGNLDVNDLLDVYVEDHNYSRFICAPRNIILVGERGSGKSMTLRFNDVRTKLALIRRNGTEIFFDYFGVLVECRTPLYARKNDSFDGADIFKEKMISEHLFVTDIAQALFDSLRGVEDLIDETEISSMGETLTLLMGTDFSNYSGSLFDSLRLYFKRRNIEAQEDLNSFEWDDDDRKYITFSSAILPIIEELKELSFFKNTHFMIMIDDAHNLNKYQQTALNTWVSFRNQTVLSFKIGCAKSEYQNWQTQSSSPILEGHDYIILDMEQPFQNATSEFGQFAKKVLAKRLLKISNYSLDEDVVEKFFPESARVTKEIEKCTDRIKEQYKAENQDATDKQIRDHGYKYGRVEYFRNRHPKANLPSYSGFNTISHLSTGVVRGLLKPCYYMYDSMVSRKNIESIQFIPPDVQSDTIKSESDKLWKQVEELDRIVRDCTEDDAQDILQLLNSLGSYFFARLHYHQSEPRVLTFTISNKTTESMERLNSLFQICRSAGLLYVRRGTGRDKGTRENYYIPNRLLWPTKGLDLIGQHGRASIPAEFLVAASKGAEIPLKLDRDEGVQLDFLEGES